MIPHPPLPVTLIPLKVANFPPREGHRLINVYGVMGEGGGQKCQQKIKMPNNASTKVSTEVVRYDTPIL